MYVDGWVLLLIYVMASVSLILSLYNFLDYKDILRRLTTRPTTKKTFQPKSTIVNKRPKGHWD